MNQPQCQCFTLTEQHIKLLREMRVDWNAMANGAPMIDPNRPYGNSNVYRDMLWIVYGEIVTEATIFGDQLADSLDRLHRETQTALQIVLSTGAMEPGDYTAPLYTRDWKRQ